MNEKYSFDVKISMSHCDHSYKLGIPETADMFMDGATDHAALLGVGYYDMAEQQLFWMAARCRYRFYRRPAALENVTMTTWPGKIKYAICNRYYTLTKGDELLAEGMTEWVIYNMATGKLETRAQEIYAHLPCSEETVCDGRKVRMGRDFSGDTLIGKHIIKSVDIDIGHHMNNVDYIRAAMSMFSTAELEAMDIKELEISYIEQSREGEELSFYRRETETGYDIGILHADGTVSATVHLVCNKIQG